MAKGDHGRMQDEINRSYSDSVYGYGGSAGSPAKGIAGTSRYNPAVSPTLGSGGMQGLNTNLYDANKTFMNNYNTGVQKNLMSYDDIMGAYRNFLDGGRSSSAARGTFSDLAGGGFSDQDKQDLRARAISPTRSIYNSARSEVDRNRALGGGYSPNHNASLAKMAREQSYNISDINTNVNASIAEMINRNKAIGASGLAGIDANDNQASLAAMGGMTNLFGSSPGLAGTFGSQALGSQNNLLQSQQLMQAIAQMMMQGRASNSQIPGNFSQAMGNIGDILGLGGKFVGSMVGLGGSPTGYVGKGVNSINDRLGY